MLTLGVFWVGNLNESAHDVGMLGRNVVILVNIVRKVINDNTTSENYIRECDDWLKKIGYYNDCEESYYKYGIVLTNITKFDTPISINDINDKNGDPIKTAPQSWMYVSGLKGE